MQEYSNSGTVMHLTLNGCTVINRGTIMHLNGSNNQIENDGTIMHNNGGRVIVMGSGVDSPQIKEKIVFRDRIIYRDRPTDSANKPERIRELEKEVQELKKKLKRTPKNEEVEHLENRCNYYEAAYYKQKEEIEQLQLELSAVDRIKLIEQIEQLREELKRSRNRERTCRDQQYAKGFQAGFVKGSNKKKEVFDWGIKPTKEQAEMLLKQFKVFLDCED